MIFGSLDSNPGKRFEWNKLTQVLLNRDPCCRAASVMERGHCGQDLALPVRWCPPLYFPASAPATLSGSFPRFAKNWLTCHICSSLSDPLYPGMPVSRIPFATTQ